MVLFLIWAFVFALEVSWTILYMREMDVLHASKGTNTFSLGLDLRLVRIGLLTLREKAYKIQAL